MEWEQALATGVRRMDELALKEGFYVDKAVSLYHRGSLGIYEYRVHSSRDIDEEGGGTTVYFDLRSGETKDVSLPTGYRSGTTITAWLVALHTAEVFGLPYRIFVCALGVLVAMLSVTGVCIWWRKRTARLGRAPGHRPAQPAKLAV